MTLEISLEKGMSALNLILIYEWGTINRIIRSHSWNSDDPSTSQDIVCLLGNMMVHYRF